MKDKQIEYLYTFFAGDQTFAVKASDVKEVKDHTEVSGISPVYHAEDYVEGYINMRGEINLVLDLRKMLGTELDQNGRRDLILFNENVGPSFGILVDKAGEIVNVNPEMIEEWREHYSSAGEEAAGNRFTSAICKMEEELISILEPERFLAELGKQAG